MLPASPLLVVKVGGRVVDDADARATLIQTLAAREGRVVLVHGGGAAASALTRALGREPVVIEGRRVTSAEDLRVAVMVYAGWTNKLLVAELAAAGRPNLGLSGADGDLVRARRRPVTPAGVDFGFVGDVERVNAPLLARLLAAGLTPVVCALSHDGAGQLLNTNADTIATELAGALAEAGEEVRLFSCLDRPGVLLDPDDDASAIAELSEADYFALREAGRVHSGMVPKLDNAFAARERGVGGVVLGDVDGLSHLSGTVLVASPA